MNTSTDLVCRLMALVEQTTDGRIVPRDSSDTDWVHSTGIDSLDLLNFLVAVEDEFGIEWQDDLPKRTLNSFEAMADYIGKELGLVA